jgi:hypothetical protein
LYVPSSVAHNPPDSEGSSGGLPFACCVNMKDPDEWK